MTVAQTLDVVYGLVNNMQVVMEGAHGQFIRVRARYETPIWQMARRQPMISDKPSVCLADPRDQILYLTLFASPDAGTGS